MKRTRIKICGITRPEDGVRAAALGVDAIGLVFYPASARAVSIAKAAEIVAALPPFVTRVALFVDAEPAAVNAATSALSLDLLQFHGEESAQYCDSFEKPYIKAIRMRPDTDLYACAAAYPQAQALLLDAYVAGVPGGTGQRFDWLTVPKKFSKEIILAGGLSAENVAQAVACVRPWAVDVSGGVEAAKGQKDAAKMADFVGAVSKVDRDL